MGDLGVGVNAQRLKNRSSLQASKERREGCQIPKISCLENLNILSSEVAIDDEG